MDDEEILNTAARAVAAEARSGPGGHPAPDALLAYHEGTLAEEEREEVQEHLAACPDCARVIVDLAAFPEVELVRDGLRLDEAEVEAAWERLRRATSESAPLAPAPPVRLLRFPAGARFAWALAASLLVVATGLAVWVAQLRSEISRPRLNVHLADLVPPEVARERGEGSAQTVSVPAEASHLVLLLNLADPRVYPEYELEVVDAAGRTAWRRRGLRRSADGTFAVEMPRGFLPAGRYRLRLRGLGANGPEPVVEYEFALAHQG